jgi:hypothetical protein
VTPLFIMQGRREIQLSLIQFVRFSFKTSKSLASEKPDGDNTDLVEDQKWHSHHHLINYIRCRREYCSDDKIYQNSVFPITVEKGNGYQAGSGKKNHQYRHLKDDAKSKKKPNRKGKILTDSWHGGQEFVVVANQKFKGRRENNKISKGGSAKEKDRRDNGERNHDPFFMFVQTGRDKTP